MNKRRDVKITNKILHTMPIDVLEEILTDEEYTPKYTIKDIDKFPRTGIRSDEPHLGNKKGTCVQCGVYGRMTRDHIFPKYFGGKDGSSNRQYMCRECNTGKGNFLTIGILIDRCELTPDEFLAKYKKHITNKKAVERLMYTDLIWEEDGVFLADDPNHNKIK